VNSDPPDPIGSRFGPLRETSSGSMSAGNRRATVVARLLTDAGVRGRLSQSVDGAWEVRVGPIPGTEVAQVIDQFVW
jgi:hypothetical protein